MKAKPYKFTYHVEFEKGKFYIRIPDFPYVNYGVDNPKTAVMLAPFLFDQVVEEWKRLCPGRALPTPTGKRGHYVVSSVLHCEANLYEKYGKYV